jgi:hypothetical protein
MLVFVGNPIARLRRYQVMARRLRSLGDCPGCGHSWSEHAGHGNDRDGLCGVCAYEFEHAQRESPEPGVQASSHSGHPTLGETTHALRTVAGVRRRPRYLTAGEVVIRG